MVHNNLTKILVTVALVGSLATVGGCGQKAETSSQETKPIPVSVVAAKTEDIIAKTAVTGKIAPLSEVAIIPKLSGKVASVSVDIGSKVKKGQVLALLDTTDLQISLNSAINGLQNAKLSNNQAKLNYDNAKTNYVRMQQLFNTGGISRDALEKAQLQYNLAKDSLNLPVVSSAQNQIDNIRNQISNATITSPIDGEVATRSIEVGEMASPSQPLLSVVNVDKVYVEGSVAESDIAYINVGQKVSVRVESAGLTVNGEVKIVSPVANPQTKAYTVKVEIANAEHKLKPGMFAEIKLVTSDKKGVLAVSKSSLVNRGADKLIYVVNNGVAEEHIVEVGVASEDKVEILKGLNAGDQYVTEGQQSLYNKAKVSVEAAK